MTPQDSSPQATAPPTSWSATNRVEAFSDGVFAIAITLLVLEVRVPGEADIEASGSLVSPLCCQRSGPRSGVQPGSATYGGGVSNAPTRRSRDG